MKVNCKDGSVKQINTDGALRLLHPLSYTINQIDLDSLENKSPTELKNWVRKLSKNLHKHFGV